MITTEMIQAAEEVAKRGQLLSECLELLKQIALLSDDIELVNAATALAFKIEQ